MGRTRKTYRDQVQEQRSEWEQMRRWLRKRHRGVFDEMWVHAEDYADAAGEAVPTDPMMGILVSICLGQQREIDELQESDRA